MSDEIPSYVKKDLDYYLAKEEEETQRLSTNYGSTFTTKTNRILKRDIIWDEKVSTLGKTYRALISVVEEITIPPGLSREEMIAFWKSELERTFAGIFAELSAMGVEIIEKYWINNTILVKLTIDQIAIIAARNDVKKINEPKRRFAMLLDDSIPLIRADVVWQDGFDGTGLDVAVLDTGVDNNHPALAGKVILNEDWTRDDQGNRNNNPDDDYGHGTHVAGIVASQDNQYRGVAHGADITNLKIGDQDGHIDDQWALDGILRAVQLGVDVINASWGYSHGPPHNWECPDGRCDLCNAADNAVNAGIVFVVAAGNEGSWVTAPPIVGGGGDTNIRCPGNARNPICVANSTKGDDIHESSSVGPTPDGRAKPDVAAPGTDIVSCRAANTFLGTPVDQNWTSMNGTSMASPHIAGVAALLLEDSNTNNLGLTPLDIKNAIMNTAIDLGESQEKQGSGRVDAKDACDVN